MSLDPILIVGMCPSDKPTLGVKRNATFRNLDSWMDRLNIRHFSFINTFDFPGKAQLKNVDFDSLQKACKGYNKVLALGNFASTALCKIDVRHYVLPHPSPLNRNLNHKWWVDLVIEDCKEYLE
jgi:hypothetical protein